MRAEICYGNHFASHYNRSIRLSVLYRMTIPDEILEDFAESGHTETSIYIKAVTSIPRGAYVAKYTGSDDLTLKKLGLLRLT